MQDFQFYLIDDRYSVPSLLFVETKDTVSARSMAERLLIGEHCQGVEVWRGDAKLFSLVSPSGS